MNVLLLGSFFWFHLILVKNKKKPFLWALAGFKQRKRTLTVWQVGVVLNSYGFFFIYFWFVVVEYIPKLLSSSLLLFTLLHYIFLDFILFLIKQIKNQLCLWLEWRWFQCFERVHQVHMRICWNCTPHCRF